MKQTIFVLLFALAGQHAFAADVVVNQKDKSFDKKEIKVKQGDTVTFINQEKDITHNVFSLGPNNAFELKTQGPGEKSTVTFKEVGTTDVECAIHTGMKMKVTVEK